MNVCRTRYWIGWILLIVTLIGARSGWTYYQRVAAGRQLTDAAGRLLQLADAAQQERLLLPAESPQRFGWHFIPKAKRKGLQIKEMNASQRKATEDLLRAALSALGYRKADQIMRLESLLAQLEADRQGGPIRDAERYYVTMFGTPSIDGSWGLSFEGHHLSLNYWIAAGQIVSSTPQFLASNPATVHAPNELGFKVGSRVLDKEEALAFQLLGMLTQDQRAVAIIADQAPREIRAAGEPQPPQEDAVGIAAARLTQAQRDILFELIREYAAAMPKDVAAERLAGIDAADRDSVHFAWAGAAQPGVGHYYRIQGPTFLIELVNTQPDAQGNPANHVHCVWRDMTGDFGVKL